MTDALYEVYAIKYATRDGTRSGIATRRWAVPSGLSKSGARAGMAASALGPQR